MIAIWARMLPYEACFGGGGTAFFGSDAYDHVRRILYAVNNLAAPHLRFDWFLGYPQGAENFWPPLYHWLVAAAAWVAALGRPDAELVEVVAAYTPVVSGAICVVLVFLIGHALAGRMAGVLAAVTLALSPAHIKQTIIGYPDNNAIEPTIAALLLFALIRALPCQTARQGLTRLRPRAALLAAAAGWIAIFSWRGAGLLLAFVAAYAFFELVVSAWNSRWPSSVAAPLALFASTLALAITPMVALGGWGAAPRVDARVISWFHVLVLAAVAGVMAAAAVFPARWVASTRARWCALGALLVAAALVGAFALFNGTGDLGKVLWYGGGRWGISEWQGLLFESGELRLEYAARQLTWAACVAPLIWASLGWSELRRGFNRPRWTLLLVWCAASLVVAVPRLRFAHLASIAVSLLLGLGAARTVEILRRRWPSCSRVKASFACCVAALALIGPTVPDVAALRRMSFEFPVTRDLFSALEWMREATPPVQSFDARPEYGVLAQWDFGSWIAYIARRPAIATPWGDEIYGMESQARFFMTEDEEEAERILVEDRARYVIVTNVLRYLDDFARMLGRNPDTYFRVHHDSSGRKIDLAGPRWIHLVSTRLLLNDGNTIRRRDDGYSMTGLRLVWESAGALEVRGYPKRVSRVKMFERVKGALIRGRTTPGAKVSLRLQLVSNRGRDFRWRTQTSAGADGTFALRVPYPTDRPSGAVRTIGPYLLQLDGATSTVIVPEDAVISGKMISLKPR